MKKRIDGYIYFSDKSGGGRIYLKRDWLVMLDVDPTDRRNIPIEMIVNSDTRELLIKKKPVK